MTIPTPGFSMRQISSIHLLWDRGVDTHEIAKRLGQPEATIAPVVSRYVRMKWHLRNPDR